MCTGAAKKTASWLLVQKNYFYPNTTGMCEYFWERRVHEDRTHAAFGWVRLWRSPSQVRVAVCVCVYVGA